MRGLEITALAPIDIDGKHLSNSLGDAFVYEQIPGIGTDCSWNQVPQKHCAGSQLVHVFLIR